MSSKSTRTQLVASLSMQIRQVSATSVLFSHAVADKIGLHPTDNECLDFLMMNGAATAGQLAKKTGLTTGAVTAIIDRLEKAGFVHREHDPQDRRKVNVIPNIAKIEAEIMPHMLGMGQTIAELCEEFSEAELAVVERFMMGANERATAVIAQLKQQP